MTARGAFLSVDVDVYSRRPLRPLVAALGEDILVHHVGRERDQQSAHFSLAAGRSRGADRTIVRLTGLISQLDGLPRQLWQSALSREFNIGVEAPASGKPLLLALRPATARRVAELHARIGFTVYPPSNFR